MLKEEKAIVLSLCLITHQDNAFSVPSLFFGKQTTLSSSVAAIMQVLYSQGVLGRTVSEHIDIQRRNGFWFEMFWCISFVLWVIKIH